MDNVYEIVNNLLDDLGISISFEKMYGLDLFPKCLTDSKGIITIYENDKLYNLLLLYSFAIIDGYDFGVTINRLNLLYSLLELNDYEGAHETLDKIIDDIHSRGNDSASRNITTFNLDDQELIQHLFILLHEIFHVVIGNNNELAKSYLDNTRTLINEILDFELENFNLCREDLLSVERISEAITSINSIFQDSYKDNNQEFIQLELHVIFNNLKNFHDIVTEINKSSKHYIVEEIACDLFAWESITNLFCHQKESQKIVEINTISLALLYSMEFNENILSQFRPRKHAKYEYNGVRALIRQKCLRYALNAVFPSFGIKYYWKNLDSNFKRVFEESVRFIQLDEFTSTYKVFNGSRLPYNKQKEKFIIEKIDSLFSTLA